MPKTEVAAIVASGSLLGQTAVLTLTIFTPSANGLFRVSVVTNPSAAAPSLQANGIEVLWTSGFGANTVASIAAAGGDATLFAVGGDPIQLQVSTNGSTNGGSYDLYWFIEQLG